MNLLGRLSEVWSVNDPLPIRVDLVVAVAHGATNSKLTRGAKAVVHCTRNISSQYQFAPIVAYGSFGGSERPEVEGIRKLTELSEIPNLIYIGLVWSTIEECRRVKESLPEGFLPEVILIVTDQAHSRRCRVVWRTFFPDSDVRIVSVDLSSTIDPESPMAAYRAKWKALTFQAVPTPFYWFMSLFGESGLLLIEGFHQPD